MSIVNDGRDNYDERHPLKYGGETEELAIRALEQLFGVYSLIKEYEDSYKEKNDRKNLRSNGVKLGEITTIATTKKIV